jgi:hypothetical protein
MSINDEGAAAITDDSLIQDARELLNFRTESEGEDDNKVSESGDFPTFSDSL